MIFIVSRIFPGACRIVTGFPAFAFSQLPLFCNIDFLPLFFAGVGLSSEVGMEDDVGLVDDFLPGDVNLVDGYSPENVEEEDWLGMEVSGAHSEGEPSEQLSDDPLFDGLEHDPELAEFEVVGSVATPPPILQPTSKSAPRPMETLEARVAVGDSSTSFLVFDTALREARESSLTLPWESGIFAMPSARAIPMRLPMVGRWSPWGSTSGLMRKEVPNTDNVAIWHKRRLLAMRFAQSDDQLLENALVKARELILFHLEDTRLGCSLLDRAGRLVSDFEMKTSIRDSFVGKAVGTILKRLTDYHRFARWVCMNGLCRPLAPTESAIYKYLCFLRTSGASATSGKSFVKAVWFLDFHVGLLSIDVKKVMVGRVHGASKALESTKRPLKQSPILTSDMVYKLEMLIHNVTNSEACILGFLLFCLFASARFADATKCKTMTLQVFEHVSLIETGTMEFKSPVEEKKMVLLPLLALGQALYGSAWGTIWFLARRRAGIEQFPFIMPAFSEVSCQWLPRRMTSVEGSLWLREFLVRAGVPEQEAGKYSSHSLKSTLLSWSALHGSLSMDERRAMGHHFDSRLAIPLVYSRDFLCQIHVKLMKMFQQIRAGVFDPEESRVQRIARETAPDIIPEEVSSGSDVEKEDCNPQKSLPVASSEPDFPRTIMPQEDFERCRQHKLSGVVHLMDDAGGLSCGRTLSRNYGPPVFEIHETGWQVFCQQCAKTLDK